MSSKFDNPLENWAFGRVDLEVYNKCSAFRRSYCACLVDFAE